jgi:hypothetical protein
MSSPFFGRSKISPIWPAAGNWRPAASLGTSSPAFREPFARNGFGDGPLRVGGAIWYGGRVHRASVPGPETLFPKGDAVE